MRSRKELLEVLATDQSAIKVLIKYPDLSIGARLEFLTLTLRRITAVLEEEN